MNLWSFLYKNKQHTRKPGKASNGIHEYYADTSVRKKVSVCELRVDVWTSISFEALKSLKIFIMYYKKKVLSNLFAALAGCKVACGPPSR